MLDPASAFPPVVSPEVARPTSLDDTARGEGLEFLAALDEAEANEARTESHVGINSAGEPLHEQTVVETPTERGADPDADQAAGRSTPSVQLDSFGIRTTEFAGVDENTVNVIASKGESHSPIDALTEENAGKANLIPLPDGMVKIGSTSPAGGEAVATKVTKINPGQPAFLPHISGSQSATPTSTNSPLEDGKAAKLFTHTAASDASPIAAETTGISAESPTSLVTNGQASAVDPTVETTTASSQSLNPGATLSASSVATENRPTVPGASSESPITSADAATPSAFDMELADAATGDGESDAESGSSQRDARSPGTRNATVGRLDSGLESSRFELPDGFTVSGSTGDSPGTNTDSPAIEASRAALSSTISGEATNPSQSSAPVTSNGTTGRTMGNDLPGDPWQDTANIRNQVTSSVLSARLEGKRGGHRMEIKLDPPELGKISIEFIGKDNELSARIQAAEPATLTALRADLPALVETLGDAGIVLDEFHLNQSSDDGDFQPGNRGQEESGDQNDTTYDDTTEMDEIDSTRRPSGRLDITA